MSRPVSRRVALARLGALGALVGCVDIATGPGGVDAIRLDTRAHAIVVGDTLRDSTGAVVRLAASAFDQSGTKVTDAPFRYVALPTRSSTDTTTRPAGVTVDSLTGAVVAAAKRQSDIARVAITVGGRLQLIDTLRLVLKPTTLTRVAPDSTAAAARLTFLCTSNPTDRIESQLSAPVGALPDTSYVGNYLPISTKLTADSSGTAVPVPGYYVQYTIVSPTSIPTLTVAGVTRPAIGIIPDATADRTTAYDTTDASGTSSAALRVFGSALGGSAFPSTFTVRVRAQARRSTTDTLKSVDLVLRLRRVASFSDTTAASCPAR